MIAIHRKLFTVHKEPAFRTAAAQGKRLGFPGRQARMRSVFIPIQMVQLREGVQPNAVNSAFRQAVRNRGQELHDTGHAEYAHFHQEGRYGALQIREYTPVREVAGLQSTADKSMAEQLAQILLGLLFIFQADGRKGTVDNSVG